MISEILFWLRSGLQNEESDSSVFCQLGSLTPNVSCQPGSLTSQCTETRESDSSLYNQRGSLTPLCHVHK